MPLNKNNQETIIFDQANVKTVEQSGTWDKEIQELLEEADEEQMYFNNVQNHKNKVNLYLIMLNKLIN